MQRWSSKSRLNFPKLILMLDTFIKLILRIITKDRIHGRIKKRDLLSPFVRNGNRKTALLSSGKKAKRRDIPEEGSKERTGGIHGG